ncbi:enoyl-CoA hydratase, partial [Pseudomonas syringae pv. tagetis]
WDMRFAASDAQFAIRDILMWIAADVGTLQGLARIIGDGLLGELAYKGRSVVGVDAQRMVLVNRSLDVLVGLLDCFLSLGRD